MKKNYRKNRSTTKPVKSKDAFHFYRLQFESMNKGQTFSRGITNTAEAAYDSWMRMTLQQREPFNNLAREANPVCQQQHKTQKNTQFGTKEKEFAESAETINEIVTKSFLHNTYTTQEYHFIAANIFCQTVSDQYYPAELALIKFTLQDGVMQTFHTHVNPESIPIGYGFDALLHSNQTHLLPVPPNAMGEQSYTVILEKINRILGETVGLTILFTLDENIPMIESLLKHFCLATDSSRRYKILSLNQLFFDLKAQAGRRSSGEMSGFKSIDEATIQLDGDKYMYVQNVGCKFHDEKERSNFCCLSVVKRWAYAISENICIDLHITLIAGKHFPMEVDAPTIEQDCPHNQSPISTWQACSRYELDTESDVESDSNANDKSSLYYPDDTTSTLGKSYQGEDLNTTISTNFSYLERKREGDDSFTSSFESLLLQDRFGRVRIKVPTMGRGRGRTMGRGREQKYD